MEDFLPFINQINKDKNKFEAEFLYIEENLPLEEYFENEPENEYIVIIDIL